jgi:putative PIG3 family NAD(P)H quinone oxidoreductase
MRALSYLPGPERPTLELVELPDPVPGSGEVLLRVRATALNRADLLQVRGQYPPPRGESDVPGLEASGEIESVGEGVVGWKPGDRAMALLAGGGHGEKTIAPVGQLMALPERLSFEEGAAIPEAAITSWTNLVYETQLQPGETVLITAAASGIGSFMVQLARELGARVFAAGRSLERLQALTALGVDELLVLDAHLADEVRARTAGQGADLVVDMVGGPDFVRHLECLRVGGRLVLVGLLAGGEAKLDLFTLMRRRLRVHGSVLRARSRAEKAALVAGFVDFALARLEDGRIRPVVDRVMPFDRIAEAYEAMSAGGVLGKIVLTME